MVRFHEVLKIVTDLQEQSELELAKSIAEHYMVRLDSMELRFNYLITPGKTRLRRSGNEPVGGIPGNEPLVLLLVYPTNP